MARCRCSAIGQITKAPTMKQSRHYRVSVRSCRRRATVVPQIGTWRRCECIAIRLMRLLISAASMRTLKLWETWRGGKLIRHSKS